MEVFVKHVKSTNMTMNNIGNVLNAKQIAEDELKYLLDVIIEKENTFQCEQLCLFYQNRSSAIRMSNYIIHLLPYNECVCRSS